LIQAFQDPNAEVRKAAVDALCKIGGEHITRALEGCLSAEDESVRQTAADALKRLKADQ
jgi:HEAT repeat protein